MKRRRSRILAIEILYRNELDIQKIEDILQDVLSRRNVTLDAKQFVENLVSKTIANKSIIDDLIAKTSTNWAIDRISAIDRNILRIAICEIFYFTDIPTKVSIDEAIEIAKKYSTEKSSSFINGILDRIMKTKIDNS